MRLISWGNVAIAYASQYRSLARVAPVVEQIGAIRHSHQFLLQLRSEQMTHGM